MIGNVSKQLKFLKIHNFLKIQTLIASFFLLCPIQNYVSALQKRVQPGYQPPSEHSTKTNSHERNTLNSDRTDRTHLTNINDSDIDKIDFGDHQGTG